MRVDYLVSPSEQNLTAFHAGRRGGLEQRGAYDLSGREDFRKDGSLKPTPPLPEEDDSVAAIDFIRASKHRSGTPQSANTGARFCMLAITASIWLGEPMSAVCSTDSAFRVSC